MQGAGAAEGIASLCGCCDGSNGYLFTSWCASRCWLRTMDCFILEEAEIKGVMYVVTEEAGERQRQDWCCHRRVSILQMPFQGPTSYVAPCWVSKTLWTLSLVPVLSLCQDTGAALLFLGISICPQHFSYMLNLASGLMSPGLCVPGCVVRQQQCWRQSCQGNVFDLQLGYFAPWWGQVAPAELHAPGVTHFPRAGAWQSWLRYSPATQQH